MKLSNSQTTTSRVAIAGKTILFFCCYVSLLPKCHCLSLSDLNVSKNVVCCQMLQSFIIYISGRPGVWQEKEERKRQSKCGVLHVTCKKVGTQVPCLHSSGAYLLQTPQRNLLHRSHGDSLFMWFIMGTICQQLNLPF